MEGGKEEEGSRKGKERGKRPCALTRDDLNPWDSEWQPASEGATVLVSNFPPQIHVLPKSTMLLPGQGLYS